MTWQHDYYNSWCSCDNRSCAEQKDNDEDMIAKLKLKGYDSELHFCCVRCLREFLADEFGG